jgi:hypothetical protein
VTKVEPVSPRRATEHRGIERFVVRRALLFMDASDLLPHRTALIGAAVALTVGLTGGLILKTGSQTAPETETAFAAEGPTPRPSRSPGPPARFPTT